MTDVRFDLEPHQWPPHAQGERLGYADAVFAVEWDGAEVEVAARWVWLNKYRAMLFFRALNDSEIYVASSWMQLLLEPRFYYALDNEQKFKLIVDHVQRALKQEWGHNYGRIGLVSLTRSKVARWLFVTHDDSLAAWSDCEFAGAFTTFRLNSEDDLTIDALTDPDSPAGFALDWSRLPHEEQVKRALCFANGDWQKFQEIVRAAVYFGAPALAKAGMIISFNGEFRISDSTSYFHNHSVYDAGVRLRRWAIYIQKNFAPCRNEELAAQHLCVAEQSLSPLIQFELPQPSQHERLEAALTLRAWVKDKIPDREARLLLPKL